MQSSNLAGYHPQDMLRAILSPDAQHVCDEEPHMLMHEDALGYMPVQLGAKLARGAYVVVRKLGWGTNSSVWLARETGTDSDATEGLGARPRFVAIKILNKHATENEEESIAHESSAQSRLWSARLSDAGYTSHPGYTHCLVMSPGSSFSETSVHGKHQCYVSTPYGTTVGQILDTTGRPFSLSATKRIVKQALLALDFVHTKAKIVHCDVKADNIFAKITADDSAIARYLEENPSETYTPRFHSNISDGPIVTVKSQPLPNFGLDASFENLEIYLADFGSVFPCEDIAPDTIYTTPYETRAPEQFLGCTGSTAIDIWAIGCLVYECLTLKTLFWAKNADDQLGLVEHHIGLFPPEFLARSPIQHMYFDPSGAQFISL
ncbi:Serine/threonine-protein kinase SRPK [Trametes pubescens]|uniref:Serine/threonine-protein kinase SRPK n=1 Tax=Trametes pubescens TaxID=154538 RepID=A0A1M2V9L0_TRAPU|nr:Serine/threonine-protein kinase SRPK [Trametes pubescens]